MIARSGLGRRSTTRPRSCTSSYGSRKSTIDSATRGSRRVLRPFSEPSLVQTISRSPSRPTQTGTLCGEPSAIRVARCAKFGRSMRALASAEREVDMGCSSCLSPRIIPRGLRVATRRSGTYNPAAFAGGDMAVTARRGEFEIVREVAERKVVSRPRTFGVTFSPSSSLSRLHVVDSGQRYEVRLAAGVVEISLNGIDWQPLTAGTDPWTQEPLPWGVSYQKTRRGEPLKPVPFDMIAVGRGRILAKEQGTDRLFHLKLDELFRTRLVTDADGSRWTPSETHGDPPVPSNCFRLDPEFFTPAGDGFEVPGELVRQYALHPASLRFPLFVEAMRAESSDGMSVPVKARVWQLIDSRSPLVIVDLDDLKCIGDAELKLVATKDRIRRVLENEIGRITSMIEDGMESVAQSVVDLTPSFPLPGPISHVVDDIDDLARSINGFLGTLRGLVEGIPFVGPPLGDIADAAGAIRDLVDSLGDTIRDEVEKFVEGLLANALGLLAPALAQMVIDIGADEMRKAI